MDKTVDEMVVTSFLGITWEGWAVLLVEVWICVVWVWREEIIKLVIDIFNLE